MTSPTAEEVERRAKEMYSDEHPYAKPEHWYKIRKLRRNDYLERARRELEQEAERA